MSQQEIPAAEIHQELQASRRDMNDAEHLWNSKSKRSAINRAYFAVYHGTLAGLLTLSSNWDKNHGTVKAQFHLLENSSQHFPVTQGDRQFVAQLQEARGKADYEPMADLQIDADEALTHARDLVDRLTEGCNNALNAAGHKTL